MLHTVWRGGSLRSWIALGMAFAVLPLAVSAVAGYWWLSRGVLASFQDVAARQRQQIDPTQRLRLLIVDAASPLDDFMDEGDPTRPAAYRAARERIESLFATLRDAVASDRASVSLVDRAQDDWTAADRVATVALSVHRAAGDSAGARLMDEFHGLSGSAVDKLGALYDNLVTDLHADHDAALRDVDRTDWLAAGAGGLSALAILVGVVIIGRVMAGSVERLVNGAELFAAGDRDHRIDVSVPPELHRVAEEFNRMIARIHESEAALAGLARQDALTHLLNRRAFDEEVAGLFAREQRFGEGFALLLFDLDHFKQVNDNHGHAIGDDVLRVTARLLSANLRPFDRLFRTGGEEFAALLPGSDVASTRIAAERLREAIAAHTVAVGDVAVHVTVSIGAVIAQHGMDPEELVTAGDAALYRAKYSGRNRVVVSGEAVST